MSATPITLELVGRIDSISADGLGTVDVRISSPEQRSVLDAPPFELHLENVCAGVKIGSVAKVTVTLETIA